MKIVGVIPSRYASTRFPGKPLADICGKPMLWWVYKQAEKASGIDDVIVATDDIKIMDVCKEQGLHCLMTSNMLGTSTERVYEIACSVPADLYVCINGDEPLIEPQVIESIIPKEIPGRFYVSNLMTAITDPVEAMDNTNIKIVTDELSNALFMSRSPIPYPKASMTYRYYKHVGVLAYTFAALEFFATTPKGKNEQIEDVNELRFIEHGIKLKMIEATAKSLSVDTPKDLEKVRKIIQKKLENGEITI